jgi:hypothetical protein
MFQWLNDDCAIDYEVKFFIENYGDMEEIRDRFIGKQP